MLQKYAAAVIKSLVARPLTADGSSVEVVLRQHSHRIKYESPRAVTVFGCWGCDWEGDSSSIPAHQAAMVEAAGLAAPAPQPAADTEGPRFDDWERRFRAANADANALAERVVKTEEEIARLDAVVTAVRVMHPAEERPGGDLVCGSCLDAYEEGVAYPCPTVRALDGGAR